MRVVASVAVLAAFVLAGCGTPSEGAEPERQSILLAEREVDGERIDLNGTMVVSGLPEEAAPILSPDQPMNCFTIATDTGERTFLGGAIVELTWTASSAATANLTLTASNLPAGSWRASGPSPLRVNPIPTDEQPVELPMHVEVAAAGAGAAEVGVDQQVEVQVIAGLLESLIDSLVLEQATC